MKLYEIELESKKLIEHMEQWAEEHDGDITDFPFSDYEKFINEEKEKKLLSIAAWIKGLNAESEAIKIEEQNLKKRRDSVDNKAQSLKALIEKYYPHDSEKISDSRSVLSYRKSNKVVIDNESLLPEKYFKTEKKPVLSDIKEDIINLSGIAHIQESYNLQIK